MERELLYHDVYLDKQGGSRDWIIFNHEVKTGLIKR